MKNLKKFLATILITNLLLSFTNNLNIFSSTSNPVDNAIFNSENNDFISIAECSLAFNIFEILSINENKMEILNAFNEIVKKNQILSIEVITLDLYFKFTAYLLMVLGEAKVPIDEINVDDFMFIKDDKSLNFTFIFIINSYIKYIEDNNLTSRIDITEAKKLLKELKEANDYFATHKN